MFLELAIQVHKYGSCGIHDINWGFGTDLRKQTQTVKSKSGHGSQKG